MVLLHGQTLDARMWDEQVEPLARTYRVLRFDMRGHGRSEGVTGSFSQRDDVLALMDFLGIKQAHLIGLSMGGRVACDIACTHPARVRSLTVMSSAIRPNAEDETFKRVSSYVETAMSGDLKTGLQSWLSDPLFDSARAIPSVYERLRAMVLEAHLALGSGAFFANPLCVEPIDPPAVDRLAQITAPCLVLAGELDLPFFREGCAALSLGAPKATFIDVKAAGHMCNMERPNVVTELVLDFLSAL